MSGILALDTATSACSVALWGEGGVRARRHRAMERGQSEALMPMVREVLDEAGAGFGELDLLAVTIGPGGFTGLRIGLAAARGMALAAGLPCLGVTTLEAVANGVPSDERRGGPLLVVLDAKRADVYAQLFTAGLEPLGRPRALLPGRLDEIVRPVAGHGERILVVGDAARVAVEALEEAGIEAAPSAAPGVPDAAIVAALATRRWLPGQALEPPSPLYLRPPDAVAPKGSDSNTGEPLHRHGGKRDRAPRLMARKPRARMRPPGD